MKQTLIILLTVICFLGCKDDFMPDNSSVNSLKVYDFDVQRVKKIHDLFAVIDTSGILFLNENGDNVFDISSEEYKNSETISFKFTDVVAGANSDLFVLGAEILKDSTFRIYVLKMDVNGQMPWGEPVKITIVNDYDYEANKEDKLIKSYFFISENGYALGCFKNNKLILVVNYQSKSNSKWFYKLIALHESGSIIMEGKPMQENHPEIWNYMIETLPNGN
jgi:hypothetical protein